MKTAKTFMESLSLEELMRVKGGATAGPSCTGSSTGATCTGGSAGVSCPGNSVAATCSGNGAAVSCSGGSMASISPTGPGNVEP